MSQEEIARLREAYAALTSGDLQPILALCDENIEVVEPDEIPDATTYRGRDGVVAVLDKLRDAFPDLRFEPFRFAASDDRVFVSLRWGEQGRAVAPRSRSISFTSGRSGGRPLFRVQAFLNRQQALDAAGLSE